MGQSISQLGEALAAAQRAIDFIPSSVEILEARNLPIEDGIWVMAIVDGPDSEGYTPDPDVDENATHLRLMAIIDEQGKVIGGSAKDDRHVTVQKQALDLFKQCLFAPIMWKPHRPRYLGFRNDVYFASLPLEEVGIHKISMFTGDSGPDILPKELEQRRACTFCRRRGSKELFELCPKCESVYYCDGMCRTRDLVHDRDMHSHSDWCAKIRQYRDTAPQLADLPFTFIKKTSSLNFNDQCLKEFLASKGVLNYGFWRWEHFDGDMPGFGTLPADVHPIGLPMEGAILETTPETTAPPMSGWKDYYDWRGFSLDSPIAVLQQWPLTIYRILMEHVPKDYPAIEQVISGGKVLNIHLIGVEKEADFVELFQELAHLFSNTTFHITMIGTEICGKVKNKVIQCQPRVKVKLVRGLYHKCSVERPHLVIGFNAGLAAYGSWVETLKKLQSEKLPAYFTDYCQYSCECGQAPMEYLGLGRVSPPTINPFRSPLRKHCEEHEMPWYSNAFIYRLIYKD